MLTAAPAPPAAHPNTGPRSGRWTADADWRQSVDLANRCFDGAEPGDFLERRAAARRRLTQAGAGAWFGAFEDGRLLAQLGLFDVGDGYARYQHVETDPAARRRGLAGTLVWTAGRYGREVLGTEHVRHRGRPGRRRHPDLPGLRLHRPAEPAYEPGAAAAGHCPRQDEPVLGDHRGDQLGRGDVEGQVERLGARRGGRDRDLLVGPLLERDRRAGTPSPGRWSTRAPRRGTGCRPGGPPGPGCRCRSCWPRRRWRRSGRRRPPPRRPAPG